MDKKNIDDFVKKVEDSSNEILEDTLLDKEASLEDTRSFSYDDIIKISKKDKMSKLPWLTAIFLILIISLTFGYMFFRYNPQTLFTSTTDKFFTYITDKISDNSYDITKGKINISLSNKNETLKLNAKYTLDSANGLSRITIYEDENKIDLYSDGKNYYVKGKNIYDGYLKYSSSSSIYKIKLSDIKSTLNAINQAIDKVLTSEKITGGKTNYDLGNKTIRVYESKLIIDKNYERATDTFINSLKSNEEFINFLSKILDKNTKSEIDNLSNIIKNKLKDNKLEIKIYTNMSDNDFIKGEINLGDDKIAVNKKDNDSVSLSFDIDKLYGTLDVNCKDNYELKWKTKEYGDGEISFTSNKASTFGKTNTEKVIDYNNLTDEEKLVINSKIEDNLYIQKIIKWFK